jgi:recombinational DNA repair protein (RecF pathway)
MSVEEPVAFLSPQSKLVRFFHRSRDKWKTKCKEAKRENKSLKYRLAVMTQSRNRWKAEARSSGKSAATQTTSVAEEALK